MVTDVSLVNTPSDSDVIKSTTLNITKATTAGAGLLGLATAFFGDNLTNFTQGQQAALVIALIGAVAIVRASDLIARALATARTTTVTTVSSSSTPASNGTAAQPPQVAAFPSVVEGGIYVFRGHNGQLVPVAQGNLADYVA